MAKREIAISVKDVSKTFKLPHEKQTSIKGALINLFRGGNRSFEKQKVLNGISFDIKKGEFFGIVGRNGSGKSTLLKLLAGIYTPSQGGITVNGKLTPFIELGVGFNAELTGRENVFLNGALLGFSRKEMTVMYRDIVAFAELEKFMDQKLKNYSSGMQVRLAFSIAIRAQSDILLIDEVLAVGDAAFQQKCFDIFAELKKKGVTMVLVTHDMNAVLRFCDRAMLINQGDVSVIGKPRDVADSYLEINYEAEKTAPGLNDSEEEKAAKKPKNIPTIVSVTATNEQGEKVTRFKGGQKAVFTIKFKNPTDKPLHFGLQIFNDAGVYCFGTNTNVAGHTAVRDAQGELAVHVDLQLMPGSYTVTAATMNENATTVYDYRPKVAKFSVAKDTEYEGIARLTHKWS